MISLHLRQLARPAGHVSTTEIVLGLAILFITFGIVTAFVYEVATDRRGPSDAAESAYETRPEAESLFPDPGVAGWRAPSRIFHYSRENLFVKIDGRVPVYLEAGVVGLTFGTYSQGGELRRNVDVYWYDMGSPANAAAVYRGEAPPAAKQVAIGDEGYEVGGAVFFRTGVNYIQVLPGNFDEAEGKAARGIAERLAARIGRGSHSADERESGE